MAELVSVTLEERGRFSYYQEADCKALNGKMPVVIRTYQTNRQKNQE
jgi:hypothetical protein